MPASERGILVRPGPEHLLGYTTALERGWSPNTMRDVSAKELAEIGNDAAGFLASLHDPKAKGADIELHDGTLVKRLPSFRLFIWDAGFCGIVNLRSQHGSTDLPPHVLGHVGFSVVPWKQRQGYASRALMALLPKARALGLDHVDLTANADNTASRRTVEKCGGELMKTFPGPPGYDPKEKVLYRIGLT